MMQLIDLRGQNLSRREMRELAPRAALSIDDAVDRVRPLMEAVRDEGIPALREQARRFDGVSDHELRVPEAAMTAAAQALPNDLRHTVTRMAERVRQATIDGIPQPSRSMLAEGAIVSQRWEPVDRVGLYVPGGKAVYPSSVVMNVVAAQAAGVRSLAIASPVQAEHRSVDPTILGVAALLGVDEVYAIGGAAAIAAFAYGVPELRLEPVDMVTGPGNIFVAAAKRVVNGTVGIDSEAGTTEILIVADDSADPHLIAADLVSQAEHDEAAASVLVTPSDTLCEQVAREVTAIAERTHHRERVTQALRGQQSALILTDTLDSACSFANAYGAEHLEIHTDDPEAAAAKIHSAGALFLGPYSPVSLGDYLAGSNHVLPTGGTARFQPGLGAHTFLRAQQLIHYEKEALADVADSVRVIAHAEGLPAHSDAVQARFARLNDTGEGSA